MTSSSESLSDILTKSEQERLKTVKTRNILLVISCLVLLIAIILLAVGMFAYTDATLLIVGMFLIGAAAVLFIATFTICERYKKQVATRIENKVIPSLYPGARVNNKSGFPLNYINSLGLFDRPDLYKGSRYVAAQVDGITFEKASFELYRRTKNNSNDSGPQYVLYNAGYLIRFAVARTFDDYLLVSSKNSNLSVLNCPWRQNENIETEFLAFNELFNVYASSKEFAFYMLTPQVLETLLTLANRNGKRLQLLLRRNEVVVVVNDNYPSRILKLNNSLGMEDVEPFIAYHSLPSSLINELDLTSYKFLNYSNKS